MRAQALVRRDKECGDDGLKDTPVPMPNTEVKLQHAESSWGIAPCEDRASPREVNKPLAPDFVSGLGFWRVVRAGRRSSIGNAVYGLKPVSRVRIPYSPLMTRWSSWLRHQPFTLVTWVRIPYGSLDFGGLAQLGERLPYKQRVTGSSPVSSITAK